MGLSICY